MARQDKVASQYAKAAFDFAGSSAKARAIAAELKSFSDVLEANKELSLVLTTQVFTEEERRGIASDIAEKMKLTPETSRVLSLLANEGRMSAIAGVAEKLHTVALGADGVVPLAVDASGELSDDEQKQLIKKFEKVLGKKVEAKFTVDTSLLGGVRVTAAGRTYDGSVAGALGALEEKLVGGTI